MRRFPVGWALLIFVIIMAVIGWRVYYGRTEFSRVNTVSHVQHAPSELYARLLVAYDKPPVYEEEYKMQDVEGVSTFNYRIRTYNGKQLTITAPPAQMYDVSFFFGSLDQDGVWQLMNQPPRGDTTVHYTVYVKQLADYKKGERTITFTDPHFWATTAGRQFNIDLSKNSPKDLLKMQSSSLADPHYEKIVNDFRDFGPPVFKERIARARAAAFENKL